jgi:hypothetical protein
MLIKQSQLAMRFTPDEDSEKDKWRSEWWACVQVYMYGGQVAGK